MSDACITIPQRLSQEAGSRSAQICGQFLTSLSYLIGFGIAIFLSVLSYYQCGELHDLSVREPSVNLHTHMARIEHFPQPVRAWHFKHIRLIMQSRFMRLLKTAAFSRKVSVPPLVQMQHTRTPEAIVDTAAMFVDTVPFAPLCAEMLRAARGRRQPRDDALRKALGASEAARKLVSKLVALALGDGVEQQPAAQLMLLHALTIIRNPDDRELCQQLLDRLVARKGTWADGDVTILSWSAQRFGLVIAAGHIAERIATFPFRYFHGALGCLDVKFEALLAELQPYLKREEITLKDSLGVRTIRESRCTTWFSDAGVPFEYSGKVMPPQDYPEGGLLLRVRDAIAAMDNDGSGFGVRYDSVLVNFYKHGKVGMRYHQDPGQDDIWTRETVVASFGCSRDFVLRKSGANAQGSLRRPKRTNAEEHHVIHMADGDVITMFGVCNIECEGGYQHCVRVEKDEEDAGPRISLVFKKHLGSVRY